MPPTTIEEARRGQAWAVANPAPRAPAISREKLAKHLRFLDSALPSRDASEDTAQHRFAVYLSLLGSYSDDALAYMSRTAVATLRWFPTVTECLAILRDYRQPRTEQEIVMIACGSFVQTQFEQWLDNLATVGEIGDVPERWINIAETRGVIRRLANGSHVIRARYHGPVCK